MIARGRYLNLTNCLGLLSVFYKLLTFQILLKQGNHRTCAFQVVAVTKIVRRSWHCCEVAITLKPESLLRI
jgi:hypothetical protein